MDAARAIGHVEILSEVERTICAMLHGILCLSYLWSVSGLLQVREDLIDGLESVVQIFRRAATAEKRVTVRVLNEEIGVGDVVAELGDIVKGHTCTALCREAAGLPAGVDTGNDGFERGELGVVEFIQGDVGGLRVFVSIFDTVEFGCGDWRGFPVCACVEDEFAEVFFEIGDPIEQVDSGRCGVEVGAGEDVGPSSSVETLSLWMNPVGSSFV